MCTAAIAVLLAGRKTCIPTSDRSPSQCALSKATQPLLSERQAQWSEKLQEYDFQWEYRPNKPNVADPVGRVSSLQSCSAALCAALQEQVQSMHFDWVTRPERLHEGFAEGMQANSTMLMNLLTAESPVSCAVMTWAQKGGGKSTCIRCNRKGQEKQAGSTKVWFYSGARSRIW